MPISKLNCIRCAALATTGAGLFAATVQAEWPMYRGPHLNGRAEGAFRSDWSVSAPKELWRKPVKLGFSSFSVGQGNVYTLEIRNQDGADQEMCVALDANSGAERWAYALGVARFSDGYDAKPDDGPRSTPTFHDGKVYAFSAHLVLACLDAASGKDIWKRDLMKEHAGQQVTWESAASPTLDGDLIFAAGGGAGQSLLAFDRATGKTVWKTGDAKMTHATPVPATIHGVRQMVFLTQKGLHGVEAKSGKQLWFQAYRWNVSTGASPVVADDLVYVSAGYGVGAGVYRITKSGDSWSSKEVWRKTGNDLANHWSTPVYHQGHLYGLFSYRGFKDGPLKCVEMATGKEKWAQDGFGMGNLIIVGDQLLVLGDQGQLAVVKPTPEKFTEIARIQAVQGKSWSTPAFSEGRIYVRSAREAAAFDASAR